MTWNKEFIKNIHKFQKATTEALPGHVIYAGDLTPKTEHYSADPFRDTAAIFL